MSSFKCAGVPICESEFIELFSFSPPPLSLGFSCQWLHTHDQSTSGNPKHKSGQYTLTSTCFVKRIALKSIHACIHMPREWYWLYPCTKFPPCPTCVDRGRRSEGQSWSMMYFPISCPLSFRLPFRPGCTWSCGGCLHTSNTPGGWSPRGGRRGRGISDERMGEKPWVEPTEQPL